MMFLYYYQILKTALWETFTISNWGRKQCLFAYICDIYVCFKSLPPNYWHTDYGRLLAIQRALWNIKTNKARGHSKLDTSRSLLHEG